MSERLKLITRGDGPDLVLLPGWAMHSGIWGDVADVLAQAFRVHLVDLPGHGVNRAMELSADLDQVTDQILCELPTAMWLGWSLGGLVALNAAIRQPRKIQKLVLVGATPSFSKQDNWEWGLDASARQAFSDGLENDFKETVKQFSVQTFGANLVDESVARLGGLALHENLPDKSTLLTGLQLLYANNLLPDLSRCEKPTLFLGGSRDRTILPESFKQAASLIPGARVEIIAGAGHAPFISHEEAFLNIVLKFLKGEGEG